MIRVCLGLLALLVLPGWACEVSDDVVRYFGQAPPGDDPVVFAPGTISLANRFEQFLLYTPDGGGMIFGVTNADWSAFVLYHLTLDDGQWSPPRVAPFLGADSSALTAALSYAGDAAFFTDARPSYPPADVWMSRRGDGGWSAPSRLGPPVSSEADEFEVAVARSGVLYFSSSRPGGLGDLDLYRAPLTEGGYVTAENLGSPVNSGAGDDLPYIAPDERYLIFASDRPGGLGNRDLYITFQVDGAWSEPRNLGAPINSPTWEIYPSVSPDGEFLFFTRRDGWQPTEDSDIYWVSARFIARLEGEARRAGRSGGTDD